MNKRKFKEKIVLTSVIALAGVCLLTVGFSTWITGISDRSDEKGLNIEVDTSNNTSIVVEATSTKDRIHIDGVTTSNEGDHVIYDGGNPKDMVIPFNFKVITSTNLSFTSLNIGLTIIKNNDTTNLNVINSVNASSVLTNDSTHDIFSRNIPYSEENYLALPYASILASDFTSDTQSLDGYNVYTLTKNDFEIHFGSFFNGLDPQDFYNPKISEYEDNYKNDNTSTREDNLNKYLKSLNAANDELNLMSTTLNGATLRLTFTAIYS